MSEELGKIERPEVSSFAQSRKLLQVPMIYAGKESPPDYLELFDKYWQQVKEQTARLEARLGSITKIYHEAIVISGEEGLQVLESLNARSHEITSGKCKEQATLECIEDKELLEEVMDWERYIVMGFHSEKVAGKVYEFYMDALRKRYEHIGKVIDQTLKDGDVGLLFIKEDHMIQFPSNIDVFTIAPPALDEIHRWARDKATTREKEQD